MNAGFDTSLRSYSTGVHPKIKQPDVDDVDKAV